jgi:oxalate---CoA ligase
MGIIRFDLNAIGGIHDIDGDDYWSPSELRQTIAGRRSELAEAGVATGARVVIAHGGTPAFFVDLFACWSLGACAACVNTSVTDVELNNLVDFTKPVLVVRQAPSKMSGVAEATYIEVPSQDPALILFTSGTTGDPKGVVHSFSSIASRLHHNLQHIETSTLARTLCVLPTHFGHGLIGNCLTPLLAGAELFLAPGGGVQRAAGLGGLLSEREITFMSSVPSFWKMVLKLSPPPSKTTLQQVSVGSAPVSAELIDSIGKWSGSDDVRNMYGITETANWAAGSSSRDRIPEDGLVGTMWGGEAAVLVEGAVQTSGIGELLLKPPAMMSGYYLREDLTAEVVKEGWYYTGDLGHIDAEGVIRITGRLKNEINRAGMKVCPEEIDLLLEKHIAVAEACTFGLEDAVAGEIVAVAIQLEDELEQAAQILREYCLGQIRRECVPERWFFMTEIPKTDRGKLNRDTVREACLAEDSG